jgi:UDP-3-O-[3-hydroxymyristoyl] glucosamine N-acyltransferase
MGGAASIDGHLSIGDDVSVAACSGVTKDLSDKSVVAGFPARPIRDWRRQQIEIKRLAEKKPRPTLRHG